MKSVLISINPRWCELIASGRKTVEVRKTRPKLETPFKVYIYQTRMKWAYTLLEKLGFESLAERLRLALGKVIGEFVCDRIIHIPCKDLYENFRRLTRNIITPSCLKVQELKKYLGYYDGYGWHISSLVIYDKPRELSEFKQVRAIRGYHKKDEPKTEGINIQRILHSSRVEVKYLTRPPQSWCYVESEGAE